MKLTDAFGSDRINWRTYSGSRSQDSLLRHGNEDASTGKRFVFTDWSFCLATVRSNLWTAAGFRSRPSPGMSADLGDWALLPDVGLCSGRVRGRSLRCLAGSSRRCFARIPARIVRTVESWISPGGHRSCQASCCLARRGMCIVKWSSKVCCGVGQTAGPVHPTGAARGWSRSRRRIGHGAQRRPPGRHLSAGGHRSRHRRHALGWQWSGFVRRKRVAVSRCGVRCVDRAVRVAVRARSRIAVKGNPSSDVRPGGGFAIDLFWKHSGARSCGPGSSSPAGWRSSWPAS